VTRGLLPRQLPLFLVRFGRRRPWLIAALALASWIAAALLASQVNLETDILSLVPRDNPVVREFRTTVERFGSVDTLLVVVHLEPGIGLETTIDYADRLAGVLRAWDQIDWVEYRVDSAAEAAVPLLDRASLFLEPAELDKLHYDKLVEHFEEMDTDRDAEISRAEAEASCTPLRPHRRGAREAVQRVGPALRAARRRVHEDHESCHAAR